jgi:hypothetical protein
MVKGTTFFPTRTGHTVQLLEVVRVEGGTPGNTVVNLINSVNSRRPDANFIVSLQIREDRPGHFLATGDAAILSPEPM